MSTNRLRHILMVSEQDTLLAGNQVLSETIRGYAEAGYFVSFVTNEKDSPNIASTEEMFGPLARRISIHRFPVSFHDARQRLMGKGWTRRLGRLPRPFRHAPTTVQAIPHFPPPPEGNVPFLPPTAGATLALDRFNLYLFERYALRTAMRIAAAKPVDLVYGFEVRATPVARKLADKLNVPLCGRYMGTILKPALDAGKAHEAYPIHLKGLQIRADLHVMSNDGTRGEDVLLRLGHPKERIMFIVDGIRKDIYRPEVDARTVWTEVGVPYTSATRVILTLSKLAAWKRLDRIIGAMPAILKGVPDAYLVIANQGELRSQLEHYAEELGVSARVVFAGSVPHPQVYRFLNACDVYVNCNDYSNLSHPVMEAMVCGKAVVSIDDGSLDGILTDGVTGVLVGLPNIRREMPARIVQLLRDDAYRSGIGRNARSFSETNLYSWNQRMRVEVERVERFLARSPAPTVAR